MHNIIQCHADTFGGVLDILDCRPVCDEHLFLGLEVKTHLALLCTFVAGLDRIGLINSASVTSKCLFNELKDTQRMITAGSASTVKIKGMITELSMTSEE